MASMPKRNLSYWEEKFRRNKRRDSATFSKLKKLGWGVLVVWECEIQDLEGIVDRLTTFIESRDGTNSLKKA